MKFKKRELLFMRSKDRIIIQKIINYIKDIEEFRYFIFKEGINV